MNKVHGCRVVLLGACLACGGGDDEPPCTFEGGYLMPYTLVSGDPSSCPSVAPGVTLVESDEQQCTTACTFADGPCETTFTCQPGNPVLECTGASNITVSISGLFGPCELALKLVRLAGE